MPSSAAVQPAPAAVVHQNLVGQFVFVSTSAALIYTWRWRVVVHVWPSAVTAAAPCSGDPSERAESAAVNEPELAEPQLPRFAPARADGGGEEDVAVDLQVLLARGAGRCAAACVAQGCRHAGPPTVPAVPRTQHNGHRHRAAAAGDRSGISRDVARRNPHIGDVIRRIEAAFHAAESPRDDGVSSAARHAQYMGQRSPAAFEGGKHELLQPVKPAEQRQQPDRAPHGACLA